MAILAMATADFNDLSILTNSSGCARSTAYARTGTHSYVLTNTGYLILDHVARSEIYCRVALLGPASTFWINFRSGSQEQCSVAFLGMGISAYYQVSTTLLGYTQVPFTANAWYVYEIYVKIHSTDGIITVKRDGVQILNVTGRTSYRSDTLTSFRAATTSAQTHYVDDLLITDDSWPGLGGIEILRPDADGYYTAWNAGDYSNVADDSDATYIATDAEVAAKHSFTLPALAADRKTPTTVGLFTKTQLSGAGAGTLRPFFRKNTTDTPGSSQALSTSLTWATNYQVQLPDEVGLEVVA